MFPLLNLNRLTAILRTKSSQFKSVTVRDRQKEANKHVQRFRPPPPRVRSPAFHHTRRGDREGPYHFCTFLAFSLWPYVQKHQLESLCEKSYRLLWQKELEKYRKYVNTIYYGFIVRSYFKSNVPVSRPVICTHNRKCSPPLICFFFCDRLSVNVEL